MDSGSKAPWANNPSPHAPPNPAPAPIRKPSQTFWGHWLVWVSAGVIFTGIILGAVLFGVFLAWYAEGDIWFDFTRLGGGGTDYITPEPYNPSPYYYEDQSPCSAYGASPDDGLAGCSAPDMDR